MIGIIGAMAEEITEIKNRITELKIIEHKSRTFYQGMLEGQKVVLVQAGIGKTNAAITTTLLLELFEITLVINIGVAGGQHNVKHQDIIVSEQVVYHDVDVTSFGSYVHGQMPGHDPEFEAEPSLIELAVAALKRLDFPYHTGRVASGDQFVYENEVLVKINNLYDNIYAIEMEACAIAQTANVFEVPFVILRSISDVIDDASQAEDFNTFLHKAAQRVALVVVDMLAHMS